MYKDSSGSVVNHHRATRQTAATHGPVLRGRVVPRAEGPGAQKAGNRCRECFRGVEKRTNHFSD